MLPMVADVLPMVTNVYPNVPRNPTLPTIKKLEQLMKNQKNGTKIMWQHCFRLKQPMNYPVPQLTLVKSASSGQIGYHRFYRLPLANHWLTIGKHW
jgi:hypothetical protein